MPRKTPFSVGERWFCKNPARAVPFYFVIIGPGERKDYKRCRIEVVDHPAEHNAGYPCRGPQCCHGMEQDYSHRHLKRYGEHVPSTPEQADDWVAEEMDREAYEDDLAAQAAEEE